MLCRKKGEIDIARLLDRSDEIDFPDAGVAASRKPSAFIQTGDGSAIFRSAQHEIGRNTMLRRIIG